MGTSLAAHAAAAAILLALPASSGPAASAPTQYEMTIVVEHEAPIEVARPATVAQPPREVDAQPMHPVARGREAVLPRAPIPSAPIVPEPAEASLVPAPPDEPVHIEDTPERREARRIMLDPAAVARSAHVDDFGPGPSAPRGPQTDATAPIALRAMSEREAETMHGDSMREEAMARPWTERDTLRARPRPDGTHVYVGHAFTAIIEADGTVRYSDRGAIEGDVLGGGGEFTFDGNDAIERLLGNDPYVRERQRFEDDNEELITRLAQASATERIERGLRRLPARLDELWRGRGTAERRRHRIFEEWRDADDGEIGARARAIIEQWIRDHLPSGGPDAFGDDELRALGEERFRPYRASGAAAGARP
jgi:hypothetical protein